MHRPKGLRGILSENQPMRVRKDRPQILFVSTLYEQVPLIAAAMTAQTYHNWRLWLLHDGPIQGVVNIKKILSGYDDSRIELLETPTRKQQYGHPMRQWALQELHERKKYPEAEYIVVTNSDNYFLPGYCEFMLNLIASPQFIMGYCDMVHNYFEHQPVTTKVARASIDIACCVFRRDVITEIGWKSMDHSSDWILIEEAAAKHGMHAIRKLDKTLVVHN